MRAFRIDNRPFLTEDNIRPQNVYQGNLDDRRVKAENLLEENRPAGKPQRNVILMLFPQFEDAKKHWTIQRDSKFYRVEINDGDILHTGDYNKVEELYMNLDNAERAVQIAQEYWEGIMTVNPKPEIFVNSATVSLVISDSEVERKNAYAIRGNLGRPGIRVIIDEE